jgi:hypothetical protein
MYVSPNRLLISWKEQSIRYYQEESPIRQAMLAASTAARGGAGAAVAAPKAPEKKRAASYRPATAEGVAGMLAGGAAAPTRRAPSDKTVTFI